MTIEPKSMRRLPVLMVVARLVGVALLASLVGSPAHAAAPNAGWEHRQAERDAAEGQRLLKEGLYDEALFKLKAAYAVEPAAATAFGIAGAQRGGGRTLEAYASYEKLLRDHGPDLSADQRQSAETALAELGLKTGTLKLAIADAETSCTVDGEPIGGDAARKPIRLLIGAHKVVLAKPAGTATAFDVMIRRGKETELAVPPRRQAAGAPVAAVPAVAPPSPAPLPSPPAAAAAAAAPRPVPPTFAAPPATASPAISQAPVVAPPPPAPAPPVAAPAPVPPAPPPSAPAPAVVPPAAPEPPPASPPTPVEPIVPAPVTEALPPTFEPAPDHTSPGAQAPVPATSEDALRVGVILGVVSLPRPVEVEVAFKVGRWFGFGVEGSFLPQLSVPAADAKLDLKAIQGVFRWYPFGGVFFLGAGLGYQNFQASFGETVDNGHLNISADMSGAFFIPQVGWMFISDSGLSFGINLGLQIPIPKEPVVTATYNGQPVPAQATSSVPQDVVDQAQTNVDNVRSVAKFIVRYPFPEIDFLRLGLFF